MNSLDKIISIILIVLLMYILPVLYNAQKQDTITQSYVSNETTELVTNIKNKGYITVEMYQKFINKIDKTNNLYNVEIIHSHKLIEPLYDIETNVFLGDYTTRYYNTYQDEIMSSFDTDGIYYFKQGDFISVKIVNRNKTLATKLMEFMYSSSIPKEQIFVTYGGMIRDETR